MTVVGARPQFVKAAAVTRAIRDYNAEAGPVRIDEQLVHTGQHYDDNMSKVFFDELEIPRPLINLEVGSGSHGTQTASMLQKLEAIMLENKPDWVLVYGDTNSTLAGSLAASKLNIPIAHVEAGLRSRNREMPEEINRIVTDSVSALLLCPTEGAMENLAREGMSERARNVGDVMYDSVLFNSTLADQRSTVLDRFELEPGGYCLATLHRAENTDDPLRFGAILEAFSRIDVPIVWPQHPRTKDLFGKLQDVGSSLKVVDPVPYLDMLQLEKHSRFILTDSGGVQKEAFWFKKPCITLRDETEWVELVTGGYNVLVGADVNSILEAVERAHDPNTWFKDKRASAPYGDGRAAKRVVECLLDSSAA